MPGSRVLFPAEERSLFYTQFFQVPDADKPAYITLHQDEINRIAKLNNITPFNFFFPLYFQYRHKDKAFEVAKSGMPFVASIKDLLKFVDLLTPSHLLIFLKTCLPMCGFYDAQKHDEAFHFLKSLYEKFFNVDEVFEVTTLFFNWVKSSDDLDELKATMLLDFAVRLHKDDDAFLAEKEKALNDAFLAYQKNKKDSISPVILVRSQKMTSTSNNGLFAKNKSKKPEQTSPNRERKHN